MEGYEVLARAEAHAAKFLAGLDELAVGATASGDELRRRLGGPLPAGPSDPVAVIDELVRDVAGGLVGSAGGRFFGFVMGGTLPVALAADWLTAAWDQNGAAYVCAPAAAVAEEVCGAWLKSLLGLPEAASFAMVTGCQMAHATALAAARHKLLAERGVDVERDGLAGAPRLRILTSENRHESIIRAARLLGIGTAAIALLPTDEEGAIRLAALETALERCADDPIIVCLQAGDLNTGAFDPFARAISLAHAARAWVHVDGAFGLWAAASERYRYLLAGVERADSWATDGHKWLNLPFDSGFVFVADPAAHSAVFAQPTSYAIPVAGMREPKDWNPEWSRRARGFAAYAALRALGRSGVAELVERCCGLAARLVDGLAALPGVEVLARPRINQGLVRFLAADGEHDRRTDAVIAAIQRSGKAWLGGTTWRGKRAMRISVVNWRTTERDVDATVAAVKAILEAPIPPR
jgi:glutamate/tyrosine decarboxylase-like PLP-dependent enzyme